MNLLKEFNDLKYGYFIKLCQLLDINYENYVDPINMLKYEEYNVGEFVDFHIIKHNGKIMCINHEPTIVDIKNFHPCQISLMKIFYKSFDNNFDYTPTSSKLITKKYLRALKENAKQIIEEIIQSINFEDNNNYQYKSTVSYKKEYERTEFETDMQYYIKNMRFFLNKTENDMTNKVTNITNTYLFAHYNLDIMRDEQKYNNTVAKHIVEVNNDVKNKLIKDVFYSTHIDYNKTTGYTLNNYIKLLNIIVKLKYKLIFKNIQRDELLKTDPFVCSKLF